MYAVVHFDDTDEVELIPSNWLVDNSKSVILPPFKSAQAITKAIRDRLPPDDDSLWDRHRIRVLHVCRKYSLLHPHYILERE